MILFHRSSWFLISLLLFFSSPVQAEHTPEHRYTISGYVYDSAGKPLPGTVAIKDASNGVLGTTEAGRSGYYEIQLHLHDSNVGNKLLIESEAGKKELIVKFNPNDKTTERLAEVNFGVVPPPSAAGGNRVFLFGLATVIAAGAFYLLGRKRKQRKHHNNIAKKKKKKNRAKV
jgi:hypothetical protein